MKMKKQLLQRLMNCTNILFTLLLSGHFFIVCGQGSEKSQEEILLHHLFGNERDFRRIIPKLQLNSTEPFMIWLNVTIFHVYDIKASEGEIDMTLKISMSWQNDLVQWNSSLFGIKYLSVAASVVWTPALLIEENVQRLNIGAEPNDTVFLNANGLNSIAIFKKVKIRCETHACHFPMDNQTCLLTVFLKSYNSSIAVLRPKDLTTAGQKSTGTWKIQIGNSKGTVVPYENVKDHFASGLQYKIDVERRPLFYVATTILPIMLLSIISSAASILPAMTGDRIALLIACLLATIVYLETLFKYLPESSSSFPLAILWLGCNLVFMTLQIILASICLNWANKEEKKKKPGKKAIFFIFYFLKFIVLFIPTVVQKISECARRRKNENAIACEGEEPVIALQEDASQSQPTSQNDSNGESSEKSDASQKSFKNAIKIVDSLAILVSIVSILAIGMISYGIYKKSLVFLCMIVS